MVVRHYSQIALIIREFVDDARHIVFQGGRNTILVGNSRGAKMVVNQLSSVERISEQ